MSIFNATSKYILDGSWIGVGALADPTVAIAVAKSQAWANGTGNNQANQFFQVSTSASATPKVYDLTGGITDDFGDTITFTKIKEIMILNKSVVAGEVLTIGGNFMSAIGGGAAVKATGTLTLTGNAGNTETVVIDGKTYTFQTSLTNTNGNVFIGGNASASLDNLIAAINLQVGAGTEYAAATTIHSTVTALASAGDTMIVTAKTAGIAGSSLTTTEGLGSGSWGGDTMSGGLSTSQTIILGPSNRFVVTNPIDEYAVTDGSQDSISIDPGADTINFDMILIGTV